MKKPRIKHEVAIRKKNPKEGIISLNASREAAAELSEWGDIFPVGGGSQYLLYIDHRFDIGEVIKYIENYEEATDGP